MEIGSASGQSFFAPDAKSADFSWEVRVFRGQLGGWPLFRPERIAKEAAQRESADLATDAAAKTGGKQGDQIDDAMAGKRAEAQGPTPTCPIRCFGSGTLVATERGLVRIEEIRVGDEVYAYDEATETVALKTVEQLFSRKADEIYVLSVGGETIRTTNEHPFYVEGEGWVEAEKLQVGDLLRTQSGETVQLDKIAIEPGGDWVFNFAVEDLSSYFVGDGRILVHNCGTLKRNDRELARNLGLKNGETPHHLIGIAEAEKYSVMHRASELGYNINRKGNGLALPNTSSSAQSRNMPYHPKRGRHSKKGYTGPINEKLLALQQRYDVGLVNDSSLLAEVRKIEEFARQGLLSGQLRLNSRYPWFKGVGK